MTSDAQFPTRTTGQLISLGLRCKCPRCGVGGTFSGYLKIAEQCPVCKLGLQGHDTGDGAVVPAMLVLGALVVGLAAYVEFTFEPPLWMHGMLWVPTIFALTIMVLQPLKGLSIALQHRYRSTEDAAKPGGQ
jgi:uncharacterized protein (DUF983 family)